MKRTHNGQRITKSLIYQIGVAPSRSDDQAGIDEGTGPVAQKPLSPGERRLNRTPEPPLFLGTGFVVRRAHARVRNW